MFHSFSQRNLFLIFTRGFDIFLLPCRMGKDAAKAPALTPEARRRRAAGREARSTLTRLTQSWGRATMTDQRSAARRGAARRGAARRLSLIHI